MSDANEGKLGWPGSQIVAVGLLAQVLLPAWHALVAKSYLPIYCLPSQRPANAGRARTDTDLGHTLVIGLYIASVLGAVAVWLILPRAESRLPARAVPLVAIAAVAFTLAALCPISPDLSPIVTFAAVAALATVVLALQFSRHVTYVGALLGIATVIALMLHLLQWTDAQTRPSVYFYVFTLIALAAAVRVITHPRPVYSALYFVMVVLASSGLFLLLQAEFMVFAMIIIYAGAILVTYMFVIMLATQPVTSDQPETSPAYDRVAREPLAAVAVGFALVAVVGSSLFQADGAGDIGLPRPAASNLQVAVAQMPGRALFAVQSLNQQLSDAQRASADYLNPDQLAILREMDKGDVTFSIDAGDRLRIETDGAIFAPALYAAPDQGPDLAAALAASVSNTNRIGINLFESHTLGIELAGVILLLSMVGAIVIARRNVEPSHEPDTESGT